MSMRTWVPATVAGLALTGCTSSGGVRARGWSAPSTEAPSYAAPSYAAPSAASRSRQPLEGGEIDDNVRLPEYLDYVASYPHGDVPKLDLTDRQVVAFAGADGRPLWDVEVAFETGPGRPPFVARTNASGRAMLPRAALGIPADATVLATVERRAPVAVPPGAEVVRVPAVDRRDGASVTLDVALVVDTTGSMSDEVAALRETLRSVVGRIAAHPSRPRVRVGGVAYRDVGDEYVTRPFDFTPDLGRVQHVLDRMHADAGGDTPEAVQEALSEAVHGLSWGGPGTVRLLFLVGDAEPHFERGVPYTQTLRDALARGIVVHPVACSGMGDTGEFVWRQLAAVTLGTFLFVSHGGGTEHHVGPYEENDLDALLLRAAWRALDELDAGRGTWRPAPAPGSEQPPVPHLATARRPSRTGFGKAPWDFGIPGWPQ
jgi:Mg-chelatase subunit ChlD